MTDTRCEITIMARPDSVWEQLADFGRLATWSEAVDHCSLLTVQRDGIGATRRVQSRSMVLIEEVTVWEPKRRLAYSLRGLPPVVGEVVNEWTIDANESGSSVTLTAHITARSGLSSRIAARAVGRRIGAANNRLLADLACVVEGD